MMHCLATCLLPLRRCAITSGWMETTAVNFHDETGAATAAFKLKAGDDAGDVAWVEGRDDINLYASHGDFMATVRKMHSA